MNHRHRDFQSRALPTELPGRLPCGLEGRKGARRVIKARLGAVQNGCDDAPATGSAVARSSHAASKASVWSARQCWKFTHCAPNWHAQLPAVMLALDLVAGVPVSYTRYHSTFVPGAFSCEPGMTDKQASASAGQAQALGSHGIHRDCSSPPSDGPDSLSSSSDADTE